MATPTTPNIIQLKGTFDREEALTAAAIKPGYLVEFYNASGVKKVRPHSTAGGRHSKMFAVEDVLQGKLRDQDYASGDLVSINCQGGAPGNVVLGWLKDGETVVNGDELVSAGDGTLQKGSSLASAGLLKEVVGTAEEVLDLTGSLNTTAQPIRVRVRS